MTNWFINFCAPLLPNDPTINFHRSLQALLLLAYTVLYLLLHLYHTCCQSPSAAPPSPENTIVQQKQEELQSESYQSTTSKHEATIKCDESNNSGSELKKTKLIQHKPTSQEETVSSNTNNTAFQEIQDHFPIVYGHFAVSMGLSLMYTPYAEQSIAALLYILLTVLLVFSNSKGSRYGVRAVWTVMCLVLIFMFMCGLLEVGQSNWDILNLDCFSNRYTPLYA